MTYGEYLAGIRFIKQNSGTEEEQTIRLYEWKTLAKPLVGTELPKQKWV